MEITPVTTIDEQQNAIITAFSSNKIITHTITDTEVIGFSLDSDAQSMTHLAFRLNDQGWAIETKRGSKYNSLWIRVFLNKE